VIELEGKWSLESMTFWAPLLWSPSSMKGRGEETMASLLPRLRVVHYINQFFGQQGGEDMAGVGFLVHEAAVGPGRLLEKILGDSGRLSLPCLWR